MREVLNKPDAAFFDFLNEGVVRAEILRIKPDGFNRIMQIKLAFGKQVLNRADRIGEIGGHNT